MFSASDLRSTKRALAAGYPSEPATALARRLAGIPTLEGAAAALDDPPGRDGAAHPAPLPQRS